MPRKTSSATPKQASAPRKRPDRSTAVPSAPAASWHRGLIVVIAVFVALAAVAYRFGDRIPRPAIAMSADRTLAAHVARHHSQLLISEIIVPLRRANDGKMTNEQALQVWKTALPVIQHHTLSPMTDRMTQLQVLDKDGKPTGQMDRDALARCLDEWEAALR